MKSNAKEGKTLAEMAGEFLREAGVLVVVFYGYAGLVGAPEKVTAQQAIISFLFGLLCVSVGFTIERERTK